MHISTTKRFDKHYAKLSPSVKLRTQARLALFQDNPFDVTLRNHPLSGKYTGYRSLNVTGDIRIIFKQTSSEAVTLVYIGTHSQLY